MFEAFQPISRDPAARRRVAASTAAAFGTYAFLAAGVLVIAGRHQLRNAERLLEVSFERALPKPAPPPPPPPPKIVKRHVDPALPRLAAPPPPSVTVPKEIPKEAPPEAPPSDAPAPGPVGEIGGPRGVAGGVPGGTGTVARPAPPAEASPVDLPEDATPAQALTDDLSPIYPETARAAGKEGVVILKFVITREGHVADIKILRGESPFVEAAVAKVKTISFQPAVQNGIPIATFKIMKFPFRLSVGG